MPNGSCKNVRFLWLNIKGVIVLMLSEGSDMYPALMSLACDNSIVRGNRNEIMHTVYKGAKTDVTPAKASLILEKGN